MGFSGLIGGLGSFHQTDSQLMPPIRKSIVYFLTKLCNIFTVYSY